MVPEVIYIHKFLSLEQEALTLTSSWLMRIAIFRHGSTSVECHERWMCRAGQESGMLGMLFIRVLRRAGSINIDYRIL